MSGLPIILLDGQVGSNKVLPYLINDSGPKVQCTRYSRVKIPHYVVANHHPYLSSRYRPPGGLHDYTPVHIVNAENLFLFFILTRNKNMFSWSAGSLRPDAS